MNAIVTAHIKVNEGTSSLCDPFLMFKHNKANWNYDLCARV